MSILKKAAGLLISLVILLTPSAGICGNVFALELPSDKSYVDCSPSVQEKAYWKSMSSDYYYNKLSRKEKTFYDRLDAACMNCLFSYEDIEKISIAYQDLGLTFEEIDLLEYEFFYSNPQYFFLNANIASSSNTPDLTVYPEFKSGSARATARAGLKSKFDEYLGVANEYSMPEEKEYAVFEYMFENITRANTSAAIQTAYGVVTDNADDAVYSLFFMAIMNACGNDCIPILEFLNNKHNIFTAINLHSYWYYVDVYECKYYSEMSSNYKFVFYNQNEVRGELTGFSKLNSPGVLYDGLADGDHTSRYFTNDGIKYFIVNDVEVTEYPRKPLYVTPVSGSYTSLPPTVTYEGKTYTVLEAKSGKCGDNLLWSLDDSGLLKITGTGAMEDFDDSTPWNKYANEITGVSISRGVTTIGKNAFRYLNLTSIVIPNGVNSIGNYAFFMCGSLASVTLSDGLNSIGGYAFSGCSSLSSITIPASVSWIGGYAFCMCSQLRSVIIPEGLVLISSGTFSNCSLLASVTIPKSVGSIKESAFAECTNLSDVYYGDSSANWNKIFVSPGNDLLRNATIHGTSNSVIIGNIEHGTVTASPSTATPGTEITLTITPDSGYETDRIYVNGKAAAVKFDMPDQDATVVVTFKTHNHTITRTDRVEPTCTKAGNITYYKCSGCNKLFRDEACKEEISESDTIIQPLGHRCEEQEVKEATCTEAGQAIYYKCSRCGKLFSDQAGELEISESDTIIPALGHDPQKVTANAATCTKAGCIEHYQCSRCGKLFSDQAGEHEISESDAIIPALGHDTHEVAAKDATCTEAGCDAHYKCSRCEKCFSDQAGEHEISYPKKEALGHDYQPVAEVPATKEHAGCHAHYECSRCGQPAEDKDGKNETSLASLTIPQMTHDLTLVPAQKPTCTEDGHIAYYECQDPDCNCKKKYSDKYGEHELKDNEIVVHATKHKLDRVKAKAATCTEKGNIEYWKCSVCGDLFSDPEGKTPVSKADTVIAALGHDLKYVPAKAETYKTDGNIEYYLCRRCGKKFKDKDCKKELTDKEIIIPKTGAPVLNEEIKGTKIKYKVTNPATDGTGTLMVTGVVSQNESVSIPATVRIAKSTYKVNKIAAKAFYGDTTVKSVSIGSNVLTIDNEAFSGCSNLESVSGGLGVMSIGSKAFANCKKLKSFSIMSAALKKIGASAFSGDKNLKILSIKNTTKLTKSGVKNSLKGSSIKTVKVKKSKVKKYKTYFKKTNSGKKVTVK